jgi:hypothetical protein
MNWLEKLITKIVINKIGGSKMFTQIRALLQNKKTYLLMLGLIIEALVQYSIDGNLGECITKIIAALGGITVKAGINRELSK